MAIFGSREYLAAGCGGDVALAGAIETQTLQYFARRATSLCTVGQSQGSSLDCAIRSAQEYQALHPDAIWGVLEKPVADYDVPPAVTARASYSECSSQHSLRWQERSCWAAGIGA